MKKLTGNKRIVEVKNLKKYFPQNKNESVKAVDDVSFHVFEGETFGLVGESGSGKSTLGKVISGILPATEGEVIYKGQAINSYQGNEKKEVNKEIQMIFQDPQTSLNPRMRILDIIAEGIDAHKIASGKKRKELVYALMQQVGLNPDFIKRYPREFSGGQRQRIGIARAIAVDPKFIVADEPISALDVSIQAQVINLFEDLRIEKELTYLFIAHDLSMVKYISDRVGVMYLGKMIEIAKSEDLFENTLHPYTQALISAIPSIKSANKIQESKERILLKGDPPNPLHPPSGCRFRTRCPHAMDICKAQVPEMQEMEKDHWVACHLYNK
ncbi:MULTISPECIES: ABC transporter ATP-binding protein [unclassified Sporosarcina]|uniref:ABC transporter ATP-binding protein n=1 Tax=unclassified Sporosarcina TaxID=2647733 RepID=UPI00207DD053|nr:MULTISPECIES: ABC transporter ATP-binding protein [unclassified Sporosarcina]GKV65590.1 ABC transporter ATP-binding protein [Sporosarcina sp. NCCP-2331]GLB55715.1 ABC transporter ATP-binding protein [Sporosarcina sp. NCCP-2378]